MANSVRMCSRFLRSVYCINSVPGSTKTCQSSLPRLYTTATAEGNAKSETKADEKSANNSTDTETPEVSIETIQAEKETLFKQLEDIQDKYKRSLAETENVRKRMQKQVNDAKVFGIQGFCKDLLEVADILGKANESVPKDEITNSNPHLKNLFEGLTMTETQLGKVFTKNGLEKINPPEGEKFDPNFHEALFEQPVPDKEAGTVAVVTKVGYKLHSRTLRPALVGVFKST